MFPRKVSLSMPRLPYDRPEQFSFVSSPTRCCRSNCPRRLLGWMRPRSLVAYYLWSSLQTPGMKFFNGRLKAANRSLQLESSHLRSAVSRKKLSPARAQRTKYRIRFPRLPRVSHQPLWIFRVCHLLSFGTAQQHHCGLRHFQRNGRDPIRGCDFGMAWQWHF